jgi:hypothetical protein
VLTGLVLQVHDEFAKLVKEFSLQRLSEVISRHRFRRTIIDREFLGADAIGDEIESTVETFGSFAARLATILFEEDCALVVLTHNCVLMTIPLRPFFSRRIALWLS